MMYWNDGWGWGAWVVMSLMTLAFVAVIATAVYLLVRPPGRNEQAPPLPPAPPPSEDRAAGILDERFARGEIDEQEYQARRDLLRAR
jgi:putative membrane protein